VSRYAENTSVSADKSRSEIEATLRRYGADQFAYMTSRTEARIGFIANGRQVQFRLAMPDPSDREFTHTPERKNARSPQQAEAAWEQATRQRWRALALVIKAKLEAVDTGITVFEDEFLAHIMLPNGRTVGETIGAQLDDVYAGSKMLELMP
jgi:hypothetical protein